MRRLCWLVSFWAIGPMAAWGGQEAGQIINVNQSYQIAFTDLGNQALKQGDIVKVYVSDDDFIYMQVLESSAILSKLGISQADDYKTNLKDLPLVAIGNKVVAPSTSDGEGKADNTQEIYRQQVSELLRKLKESKEEIGHLQQVNQFLEAQIHSMPTDCPAKSKDTSIQLKQKLQKMEQLLNQN